MPLFNNLPPLHPLSFHEMIFILVSDHLLLLILPAAYMFVLHVSIVNLIINFTVTWSSTWKWYLPQSTLYCVIWIYWWISSFSGIYICTVHVLYMSTLWHAVSIHAHTRDVFLEGELSDANVEWPARESEA